MLISFGDVVGGETFSIWCCSYIAG